MKKHIKKQYYLFNSCSTFANNEKNAIISIPATNKVIGKLLVENASIIEEITIAMANEVNIATKDKT